MAQRWIRTVSFLTAVSITCSISVNNDVTDWSTISPYLADMASQLPSIPTIVQASSLYSPDFEMSNGAPFATYDITNFPDETLFCKIFLSLYTITKTTRPCRLQMTLKLELLPTM